MLPWLKVIQQSKVVFQNGSETFNFMSSRIKEIDLDHSVAVCPDFSFQYFELPYGNFLPSLIPAGKVPELRESSLQNGDLPSKSMITGNISISSTLH